jgi:predicted acetyltransferase
MAGLVRPSLAYRESFISALDEFPAGEQTMALERQLATADLEGWVRTCAAWEVGEDLPNGWVPVTNLWLIEGREYIGSVNVRHELSDWLFRFGGHIGYAIRPSRRRRGYGTLICHLALGEARGLGLDRVLITCDDDNVGSAKVIEANGGVLEDVVPQSERPVPKRRYWVQL